MQASKWGNSLAVRLPWATYHSKSLQQIVPLAAYRKRRGGLR